MDIETIDQAPSEVRLHRVLWLVKFLRALVLHVLVAVVAAAVYFLTGFDKLSPLAIDMIRSMRAQAIQGDLDGNPLGQAGFAIAAAVLFVAFLTFVTWIYRSITNVRRRALQFQAILWVAVSLWNSVGKLAEVRFAFGNLDAQFAVLSALGSAMTILVVPLLVGIALWTVARSPEPSSFVATLDPRLAPGLWTYVNKLLDLPRTPLRTTRTAVAYVLAVAGALLLIESMMYLITAGSTSNKLAALAIACRHRDLLPDCVVQSERWARQIPFFLLVAIVGVKVAAFLQSTAKRLGGLSVAEVLRRPNDPFVLYLRPFDTDDVILPRPRLPPLSSFLSYRPFPVRIEEELFDVADGYRPLIAVGKPGSSKEASGGLAYRTYLADSEWQGYVVQKIHDAQRIVLLLKDSAGVRWELERVIRGNAAAKTLFLLDPAIKDDAAWEALAATVLPLLRSAALAPAGFGFASRPIGFYFDGGKLVEIVNANRTATSYRTAFSHFLAARPAAG
jgi:hypothetical protein